MRTCRESLLRGFDPHDAPVVRHAPFGKALLDWEMMAAEGVEHKTTVLEVAPSENTQDVLAREGWSTRDEAQVEARDAVKGVQV